MLLRRAAVSGVRALSASAAGTSVAGVRAAAATSLLLRRAASRAASAESKAAAASGSNVASSALQGFPATQLSYLTSSALSGKASGAAPLQAVALFLTEEDLPSALAAARAGAKDEGAFQRSPLPVDALLSVAGALAPGGGVFEGAVTHAPESLAFEDFKAKSGETLWLYPTAAPTGAKGDAARGGAFPRLLLVGLGPAASVQLSSYRSATWKAISSFQSSALLTRVGVILPQPPVLARFFDSHLSAEIVGNVARIAALSTHFFRRHLSPEIVEKRKKGVIGAIDLIDLAPISSEAHSASSSTTTATGKGKSRAASARASMPSNPLARVEDRATVVRNQHIVASATALARDLANERGDVVTPLYMEQQARALASKHGLGITVLQDADLEKEGLELIRAVGRGATHKARIVILEWKGTDAAKTSSSASTASDPEAPLANVTALVGKGVTFDTGGLLIKGRGNMEGMHMDMSGSAAVLAIMQALPQLNFKGHVVGVLALAENAIGPEAFKPLAILPSAKGSVEIIDTDAEGRLVLADAMTLVQRRFRPARMIDMATLTGAAVVALGENRAALFANENDNHAEHPLGAFPQTSHVADASSTLASQLLASGERVGERLWRMPIDDSHRDEIKGTHSDWRNCAPAKTGGSCVAAAFLEKFVEKGCEWAHIDLAGPAMRSKDREWEPAGGTGFGTQLVLDYLQQQERVAGEASAVEQVRSALKAFKESDLGPQQE